MQSPESSPGSRFEAFIDYLERRGFAVGVPERARALAVATTLAARGAPVSSWLASVGPVVCRSAAEQAQFDEALRWWQSATEGRAVSSSSPPSSPSIPPPARWGVRAAVGALIAILAVVAALNEGRWLGLGAVADETVPPNAVASDASSAQSSDQDERRYSGRDSSRSLPPLAAQKDDPVQARPKDTEPSAEGPKGAGFDPAASQQDLQGEASLEKTEAFSPSSVRRRSWWRSIDVSVVLTALGPFALVLLVFVVWLRRLRTVLRRERIRGRTPLRRMLRRADHHRLFASGALRRSLQALRRPRPLGGYDLDAERTVVATAKAGGLVTPQWTPRLAAPEYLVLVDAGGFEDHRGRLFSSVVDGLANCGVHLTRFDFQDVPSRVWRQQATLTLDELFSRHPDDRLIVCGDGDSLFDPTTGQATTALFGLERWSQRTLLTPKPEMEWHAAERRLSEVHGFDIVSTASASLAAWAERVVQNGQEVLTVHPRIEFEGRPAHLVLQRVGHAKPSRQLIDEVLDELRRMEPDTFRWLCACAVYPALTWPLTLHLGKVLKDDHQRPLHREERLMALVRLPWFRQGWMPQWTRLALIASLTPQDEATVKDALQALIAREDGATDGIAIHARDEAADMNVSVPQDVVLVDFMAGRASSTGDFALRSELGRALGASHGRTMLRWLTVAFAGCVVWATLMLWPSRVPKGMVRIPAGAFVMGCDLERKGKQRADPDCESDEAPRRTERLPEFFIDRFEVTKNAYAECVADAVCTTDGLDTSPVDAQACTWPQPSLGDHPINCVTRTQAAVYCAWLGRRLPTSAELEKACRGDDGRRYCWGERVPSGSMALLNIAETPDHSDGIERTAYVGAHAAGVSPYGVHDLLGNVWELTSEEEPKTKMVIVKGGAWRSEVATARASNRSRLPG
ncbi:MAG: SUMF1/EgtB/PvdO family nonheme iron enzyme, partial [Myxococcota bacterium]